MPAAVDAIVLIDDSGRVLGVYVTTRRMFGYDASAAIRRSVPKRASRAGL